MACLMRSANSPGSRKIAPRLGLRPKVGYLLSVPYDNLDSFLVNLAAFEQIIIDPFYVVDANHAIVHFNQLFFSMMPRGVSRGLKGKSSRDIVELELPGDKETIEMIAWSSGRHTRLNEISGRIAKDSSKRNFIVSAFPVFSSSDPIRLADRSSSPSGEAKSPLGETNAQDNAVALGAMILLRDVSDEADVQLKYQQMLDNSQMQAKQLEELVRTRSQALVEANKKLIIARKDLIAFRRGRFI